MSQISVRPPDDPTYDVDMGHGWVLFAGIMLAIGGVLNVIHGIAAISNSKALDGAAEYVVGDLNSLGWFLLVCGAAQVIVAFGIWAATEWGRWLGVAAACANMLIQFAYLPAQPGFAIMMFLVDVLVIYGLITYGGRDRDYLGQ